MSNSVADKRFAKKRFAVLDRNEKIGNTSLNWNRFRAKNLHVSIRKDKRTRSIDVVLDGGFIDGDLIINGLDQKIRSVRIINCQVSGKISIYSVKAKEITIISNCFGIDLVDSDINALHICSQVSSKINLVKLNCLKVELNGHSEIVDLKRVCAERLTIDSFETNFIAGNNLNIKKIKVFTDSRLDLKRLTSNKIYFYRRGSQPGIIHGLKNARLKI